MAELTGRPTDRWHATDLKREVLGVDWGPAVAERGGSRRGGPADGPAYGVRWARTGAYTTGVAGPTPDGPATFTWSSRAPDAVAARRRCGSKGRPR